MTKGRLSQIENGECSELTISRIETIADYLKVDFFELVCPLNEENKNNVETIITSETIKNLADELIRRMIKSV